MRLSEQEAALIRQTAEEVFGQGTRVHLFGSRVDDQRKGGDIDLYLELPTPDTSDRLLANKARLLRLLWQRLGPQRIDLLIRPQQQQITAIHRDALEHGVRL